MRTRQRTRTVAVLAHVSGNHAVPATARAVRHSAGCVHYAATTTGGTCVRVKSLTMTVGTLLRHIHWKLEIKKALQAHVSSYTGIDLLERKRDGVLRKLSLKTK